MVRFEGVASLGEFLAAWEPEYRAYANSLWEAGVRSTEQIAHAEVDSILPCVGGNPIYASDILARANKLRECVL